VFFYPEEALHGFEGRIGQAGSLGEAVVAALPTLEAAWVFFRPRQLAFEVMVVEELSHQH